MNRIVGRKMPGSAQANAPAQKWTPPPLTSTTTVESSPAPQATSPRRWQPPKAEPTAPPPQQPKKVWKYQQTQQQSKVVYSGPPMDLSTRVNYLNSLHDQGSINDKEYDERSGDLRVIADIVSSIYAGDVENLKPQLEENGHLLPLIWENESNVVHLATEAIVVSKARAEVLSLVLEHGGADVNSVRKGYTPLLSLCTNCKSQNVEEAIKILVRNGADVNKGAILKESQGADSKSVTVTPLAAALVAQADVSVIRFLCQNGADPNTNTEDGPVLNWAIIYGKDAEAQLFLEHGANPNSREFQQGATCLASAVIDGKVEIVKLLLKHGADRNAPIMRSQQVTAKELAKQYKAGNPAIATIEQLL